MGYALARAAVASGAKVTLISGPVSLRPPEGCTFYAVNSALDMYEKVMENYESQDIVIKAAAVADYRPAEIGSQKIKKNDEQMTINLVRNPDILLELGKRKKHQMLIGFAAETEKLMEHAAEKLTRKNLDMIIANDVSMEGAGFLNDTNQVTILNRNGETIEIQLSHKDEIARKILETIAAIYQSRE
jgi:phosphopantothenoylcysteine decarboxylase / phosphopantothenate---cysteine ligase